MANAFSVTALQLVNRVNRRRRMDVVGDIVALEDFATLDSLNTAMHDVLNTKDWEFDERHDGHLALEKRWTTALATVTGSSATPSSTITLADAGNDVGSQFRDGSVARLVITGDSDYANTAIRLESVNIGSPSLVFGTLQTAISKSISIKASTLYWAEYILPDTVGAVTRVRYQESPLTLEQVNPRIEFDELYPRHHIEYGAPEKVAVGGFDRETYKLPVSVLPYPGLRLHVWPVPDERYILNYSYRYRHPDLEDAASTLDGVPPEVVDQIVDRAAADMKLFYEDNPDAVGLRNAVRADGDEKFMNHSASRAARRPIGNWDGKAGRARTYRDPFGGKLLGGS